MSARTLDVYDPSAPHELSLCICRCKGDAHVRTSPSSSHVPTCSRFLIAPQKTMGTILRPDAHVHMRRLIGDTGVVRERDPTVLYLCTCLLRRPHTRTYFKRVLLITPQKKLCTQCSDVGSIKIALKMTMDTRRRIDVHVHIRKRAGFLTVVEE